MFINFSFRCVDLLGKSSIDCKQTATGNGNLQPEIESNEHSYSRQPRSDSIIIAGYSGLVSGRWTAYSAHACDALLTRSGYNALLLCGCAGTCCTWQRTRGRSALISGGYWL